MAQKRPHNGPSPPSQFTFRGQTVHQSGPIQDRSSTFIAIYSSSVVFLSSPRVLQQYPGFEDASHRIVAWRRRSNQLSLGFGKGTSSPSHSHVDSQRNAQLRFETGSDEDGEKYAGRKVEAVLERAAIEGVVVVARWYGGVMLGPVRFKYIEDCANEAIKLAGGHDPSPKRARTEDDVENSTSNGNGRSTTLNNVDNSDELEKLVKTLEGRDGSIDVLRTLLTVRTEKLDKYQEAEVARSQSPESVASKHAPMGKVSEKQTTEDKEQPTINQISSRQMAGEEAQKAEMVENDQKANGSETAAPSVEPIPKSTPNYAEMSIRSLRQLEKARDATIRWILKQIDDAEEKLQLREEASYKKVKQKAEGIRREEREEEKRRMNELEKQDTKSEA